MSAVFISYRRDDSAGHTGRLYDHLRENFGKDFVFRDIDTIEPGTDFVEAVEEGIKDCSALIVVIGNEWLSTEDEMGRRLDDPNDFVRIEIAAALKKKMRVIPVLVQGAKMPAATALPEDIATLSRRHALELSDSRWDYDMSRLIETLSTFLSRPEKDQNEPDPIIEHEPADQTTPAPQPPATPQPKTTEVELPAHRKTNNRRPVLILSAVVLVTILAIIVWQLSTIQKPSMSTSQDDSLSKSPALPGDSNARHDGIPGEVEGQTDQPASVGREEKENTPDLTSADSASPEKDDSEHIDTTIQRLVEEAYQDIAALRLTSPRGNNAYEKFRHIQEIKPEHPATHEGFRAIARQYINLGEKELSRHRLDKAEFYLEQARNIDSGADGLQQLDSGIHTSRKQSATRQPLQSAPVTETIHTEQKKEPRDQASRDACMNQCEIDFEACKNTQRNSQSDCRSQIKNACEPVHEECLNDTQLSTLWGETSAEAECLGRWNQCLRDKEQQCQSIENEAPAICNKTYSSCQFECSVSW